MTRAREPHHGANAGRDRLDDATLLRLAEAGAPLNRQQRRQVARLLRSLEVSDATAPDAPARLRG